MLVWVIFQCSVFNVSIIPLIFMFVEHIYVNNKNIAQIHCVSLNYFLELLLLGLMDKVEKGPIYLLLGLRLAFG
jgi:hypothetical protein